MRIRIRVDLDGADPEKLNNQWRRLHEEVERLRKDAPRVRSGDIGVVGDFRKFADRAKHNERPDPLEANQ